MGLVELKKLDFLDEAGDGGMLDKVSTVRSDKDGRTPRRPLLSRLSRGSSGSASNGSSVSPPRSSVPICGMSPPLRKISLFLVLGGYFGKGFLNTWSSDGLCSLAISRPGSASSLSRDGEVLPDRDGLFAGKGILDVRRGMPLGRLGVLCRLSIGDRSSSGGERKTVRSGGKY